MPIPCPDPLLGADLISITVQALIPSTTTPGLWETTGSAQDLTAYIRRTEDSEDTQARDIRPVNSKKINMVPLAEGESLTIACLARSSDQNIMNALWRGTASKRFEVSWVEGEETKTGRFTGLNRRGGISDYGENTIEWNLGPMNDGTTGGNVTVEPTTPEGP